MKQIVVVGAGKIGSTIADMLAETGDYQVTGRVAGMGGGVIRKKADRIISDFFTKAGEELGGDQ